MEELRKELLDFAEEMTSVYGINWFNDSNYVVDEYLKSKNGQEAHSERSEANEKVIVSNDRYINGLCRRYGDNGLDDGYRNKQ